MAVILSNLLENGLKYAPSESPVILRADKDAQVHVENLAPNLDAESLQTLQQRFVRGSERNKPGAGLGLAIVSAFCQQLDIKLALGLVGTGRGQRLQVSLDFSAVTLATEPALPSPKSV